MLAVAKATGETLWKADRPARTGWSSPVVADLAGTTQVVVSSGGSVDGYDAATGERLWTHDGLAGNSVPSPAVVGDRVYVGARLGRTGGDVAAVAASNRCLRVRRDGGAFAAETVWQADKVLSHYASPLVAGGRAYFVNNVGVVSALDAASGETLARGRTGRPCWATPVAAGGRIYVFGDDGTTAAFDPDSPDAPVAVNRLWDESNAPAGDPFASAREGRGDAPSASGPRTDGRRPDAEAPVGSRAPSGSGAADAEYDRPTVFGVAAADGAFFVRTGTRLYCVRGR